MAAILQNLPAEAPKLPPPIDSNGSFIDYQETAEASGFRFTLFVQSFSGKTAGKRREEMDLLADMLALESSFRKLAQRSKEVYGHP